MPFGSAFKENPRHWYLLYEKEFIEHQEVKLQYAERQRDIEMLLAEIGRLNAVINSSTHLKERQVTNSDYGST